MGKKRKQEAAPNHIITAFIDEAGPVFAQHFTRNCCINATRVLIDVLGHFKVKAVPLSVNCVVHNKLLVDFLKEHGGGGTEEELDVAYANGAWGVRIDEKVPEEPGGWAGHLVAIVQDKWLVDASAGQLSRPDKGILLPPILLSPASRRFLKGSQMCVLDGPAGAVLLYKAKPSDKSFEAAPGFRHHDINVRVAVEIIQAMRARGIR